MEPLHRFVGNDGNKRYRRPNIHHYLYGNGHGKWLQQYGYSNGDGKCNTNNKRRIRGGYMQWFLNDLNSYGRYDLYVESFNRVICHYRSKCNSDPRFYNDLYSYRDNQRLQQYGYCNRNC